jgi:hypothetical protein
MNFKENNLSLPRRKFKLKPLQNPDKKAGFHLRIQTYIRLMCRLQIIKDFCISKNLGAGL